LSCFTGVHTFVSFSSYSPSSTFLSDELPSSTHLSLLPCSHNLACSKTFNGSQVPSKNSKFLKWALKGLHPVPNLPFHTTLHSTSHGFCSNFISSPSSPLFIWNAWYVHMTKIYSFLQFTFHMPTPLITEIMSSFSKLL
jgi:hypothetical protein